MLGKNSTHLLRLCGILQALKNSVKILENVENKEKKSSLRNSKNHVKKKSNNVIFT